MQVPTAVTTPAAPSTTSTTRTTTGTPPIAPGVVTGRPPATTATRTAPPGAVTPPRASTLRETGTDTGIFTTRKAGEGVTLKTEPADTAKEAPPTEEPATATTEGTAPAAVEQYTDPYQGQAAAAAAAAAKARKEAHRRRVHETAIRSRTESEARTRALIRSDDVLPYAATVVVRIGGFRQERWRSSMPNL